MTKFMDFAFGTSWKTSLVGLGAGLIVAVTTFAQAQPQPGWYVVAIAFGALGRLMKDADKTGAGK